METLRQVQAEMRHATEDEQRTLARWSGWGALPIVFDIRPVRGGFDDDAAHERAVARWEALSGVRDRVRELLSDDEWAAARHNTLNAHYTDAALVSAMWSAVRDLGFRGGQVLEPGSGSGNFIGLAPRDTPVPVVMTGVEADPVTAGICRLLYPDAQVVTSKLEDARLPEGVYDAAVGNVPFGDYTPFDEIYNKDLTLSIHDLFALKALATARPGGVVALITSRFTLDAKSDHARTRLYELGDLVGAVRLPLGAHQAAAGTPVVTDVLLLRRRAPGEEPGSDEWLRTVERTLPGHDTPIRFNAHYAAHPEHVLGELGIRSGPFGPELTVVGDARQAPQRLAEVAAGIAAADETNRGDAPAGEPVAGPAPVVMLAGEAAEGSLNLDDAGQPTIVDGGRAVPLQAHPEQRDKLIALIGLKQKVIALYAAEAATTVTGETPELAALRRELREAYRAYRKNNPPLSKPRQIRMVTPKEAVERARAAGLASVPDGWKVPTAHALIDDDPDAALLFGLEEWDEQRARGVEQQVLTERVLEPRAIPVRADSPENAIAIALEHDGGALHMSRVQSLLGLDSEQEATDAVAHLVFRDPDGAWVPRWRYLSGDVRLKLRQAREAAESDPMFAGNVAALERVQPQDLTPAEIKVKVGAPWVSADVYTQFLNELGFANARVRHAGGTQWEVRGASDGELARSQWGTPARNAQQLFMALLRQSESTITVTVRTRDRKTVVDQEATDAAKEKARLLAERWDEWVWADEDRSQALARTYNDLFNNLVLPEFDSSPLTLPGLRADWTMLPHQNAAIRRIVTTPTTLLAHVVGAGKTATMVAGAMELRRTGLVRKPAIVVPNHMIKQFTREFRHLYPNARLLAITARDLHHSKRAKFMARAATAEWDAIIFTHGALERVPLRPSTEKRYLTRELGHLREQIEAAKAAGMDSRTVKQVEKSLANAEGKLKERLAHSEDGVFFEDTGIDHITVDESHEFKNLRTISEIPGAAIDGSARATKLHMVLEHLRDHTASGRVAVMATGTPVANSVTEAYVLSRYLAPDLLARAGLEAFDLWAATFGEVVSQIEPDPKGGGYRSKARFSRFFNVPELLAAYRSYADVQMAEDLKLPTPPVRRGADSERGEVVMIPATPTQRAYLKDLKNQRWIKEPGGVLKALGLGLRASLDMRLVGHDEEDGSKLAAAAEQIADIHRETKDVIYPVSASDPSPQKTPGGLQLVFLDEGTPGGHSAHQFNLYADLRDKLVDLGVPREKVRFIHEANSDVNKEKLFAACRNGEVAILVGSTQKMGTGTNVQDRAVALHHLSYPWRPADMAQRDGRIERRGNLNNPRIAGTPDDVRIIYYLTTSTFDEFRLNTLSRKARFISQIQRRDFNVREIEDIGSEAMNLGMLNALASGDPTILEHVRATADRARLNGLARSWDREQDKRASDLRYLERSVGEGEQALAAMRAAATSRTPTAGDDFSMIVIAADGAEQRCATRKQARAALGARMAALAHDLSVPPGQHVPLGRLGGQDFHGEIRFTWSGARYLRLRFAWAHIPLDRKDVRAEWDAAKVREEHGHGGVRALENFLGRLDEDIVKLVDAVAEQHAECEEVRAHHKPADENPYREQARSRGREEHLLGKLVIANEKEAELAQQIDAYGENASEESHDKLAELRATITDLRSRVATERAIQAGENPSQQPSVATAGPTSASASAPEPAQLPPAARREPTPPDLPPPPHSPGVVAISLAAQDLAGLDTPQKAVAEINARLAAASGRAPGEPNPTSRPADPHPEAEAPNPQAAPTRQDPSQTDVSGELDAAMEPAEPAAAQFSPEATAALAGLKMGAGPRPTDEQQEIIAAAVDGKTIVVQAGAGTGKTSTLRMISQALPGRGLYVAFNRSTADAARDSFPRNVTASTAHALAFRAVGGPYQKRMRDKARRRAVDVATGLGITGPTRVSPDVVLAPAQLAQLVTATVVNYCRSAEREITAAHVSAPLGVDTPADRAALAHAVLPHARRAWQDVANPNGSILRFEHQHYLKLFQLSEPRLGADFVFYDEAQDANPATMDIIARQDAQIIVVGDSAQAINGWNGAVDALPKWPADTRLTLSRSWRFGEAIAEEANAWLDVLDAPLRLTGNPNRPSSIGDVPSPDAILCRSNAGAMAEALAALSAGQRPALVGGAEDIRRMARAAAHLQAGRRTDHPELMAFGSWSQVRDYVQVEESASDLKVFVRLVDSHSPERLLDAVDQLADERHADLIISTAHKAKGLEWDTVRVGSDFREPVSPPGSTEPAAIRPDEAMLAYVTVTRAQDRLARGSLAYIDRYRGPAAISAAPHTSVPTPLEVTSSEPTRPEPEPTPILATSQSERPADTRTSATPLAEGDPVERTHDASDSSTSDPAEERLARRDAQQAANVIVIEHTHEGTTVTGTDKADLPVRRAMHATGFRWSGNIGEGAWYLPRPWRYRTRGERVSRLRNWLEDLGRAYSMGTPPIGAEAESAAPASAAESTSPEPTRTAILDPTLLRDVEDIHAQALPYSDASDLFATTAALHSAADAWLGTATARRMGEIIDDTSDQSQARRLRDHYGWPNRTTVEQRIADLNDPDMTAAVRADDIAYAWAGIGLSQGRLPDRIDFNRCRDLADLATAADAVLSAHNHFAVATDQAALRELIIQAHTVHARMMASVAAGQEQPAAKVLSPEQPAEQTSKRTSAGQENLFDSLVDRPPREVEPATATEAPAETDTEATAATDHGDPPRKPSSDRASEPEHPEPDHAEDQAAAEQATTRQNEEQPEASQPPDEPKQPSLFDEAAGQVHQDDERSTTLLELPDTAPPAQAVSPDAPDAPDGPAVAPVDPSELSTVGQGEAPLEVSAEAAPTRVQRPDQATREPLPSSVPEATGDQQDGANAATNDQPGTSTAVPASEPEQAARTSDQPAPTVEHTTGTESALDEMTRAYNAWRASPTAAALRPGGSVAIPPEARLWANGLTYQWREATAAEPRPATPATYQRLADQIAGLVEALDHADGYLSPDDQQALTTVRNAAGHLAGQPGHQDTAAHESHEESQPETSAAPRPEPHTSTPTRPEPQAPHTPDTTSEQAAVQSSPIQPATTSPDATLAPRPTIEVALAALDRGWHVFPLAANSKKPAIAKTDWQQIATTDPAQVTAWWSDDPHYNVGVVCAPSGLVLLDLDVPKTPPGPGEPRHGRESLLALAAGRELPTTLTVATPSGGEHQYFLAPNGVELRSTVKTVAPLIDTRAVGGYAIAPGSIVNGVMYEVTVDAPVAELPGWLLEALTPPPLRPSPERLAAMDLRRVGLPSSEREARYVARALAAETEAVRNAVAGVNRNDMLNRAAYNLGQLAGAGLVDGEQITALLAQAAAEVGLPDREADATIASGLGAGMANPRTVPPPTERLPPPRGRRPRSRLTARPPIPPPPAEPAQVVPPTSETESQMPEEPVLLERNTERYHTPQEAGEQVLSDWSRGLDVYDQLTPAQQIARFGYGLVRGQALYAGFAPDGDGVVVSYDPRFRTQHTFTRDEVEAMTPAQVMDRLVAARSESGPRSEALTQVVDRLLQASDPDAEPVTTTLTRAVNTLAHTPNPPSERNVDTNAVDGATQNLTGEARIENAEPANAQDLADDERSVEQGVPAGEEPASGKEQHPSEGYRDGWVWMEEDRGPYAAQVPVTAKPFEVVAPRFTSAVLAEVAADLAADAHRRPDSYSNVIVTADGFAWADLRKTPGSRADLVVGRTEIAQDPDGLYTLDGPWGWAVAAPEEEVQAQAEADLEARQLAAVSVEQREAVAELRAGLGLPEQSHLVHADPVRGLVHTLAEHEASQRAAAPAAQVTGQSADREVSPAEAAMRAGMAADLARIDRSLDSLKGDQSPLEPLAPAIAEVRRHAGEINGAPEMRQIEALWQAAATILGPKDTRRLVAGAQWAAQVATEVRTHGKRRGAVIATCDTIGRLADKLAARLAAHGRQGGPGWRAVSRLGAFAHHLAARLRERVNREREPRTSLRTRMSAATAAFRDPSVGNPGAGLPRGEPSAPSAASTTPRSQPRLPTDRQPDRRVTSTGRS